MGCSQARFARSHVLSAGVSPLKSHLLEHSSQSGPRSSTLEPGQARIKEIRPAPVAGNGSAEVRIRVRIESGAQGVRIREVGGI